MKNGVSGVVWTLFMFNILTLAFNIQLVKAEPKTWYVDDDGSADFKTIQEAIDAASRGETIYVYAGVYYEHIYVWKSLTLVGEDRSTTIIDGEGFGNVVDIQSDYVTLRHFTIRNSSNANWVYTGLSLSHRRHCTIVENTVELCGSGIIAGHSHLNNIRRNMIINFTYGGIILYYSTFNTVEANYVTSNISWTAIGQLGIHLDFAADSNIIANNTVESSQFGIEVERSSKNEFINNTVYCNEYGIVFYNWYRTYLGTENRLQLNNLTDNRYHFSISGYHVHHYIQNIDTTNLINGKPVLYLVNQHNLVIDSSTFPNIGYLGLINSSYITVRNVNITKNPSGILLAYTRHSIISNTSVSHGIFGMRLANSSNNTIFSNSISDNNYTFAFCDSSDNVMFHNNLIGNAQPIYDYAMEFSWISPSINNWDDGYPSGGNYWSDHASVDDYSGINQDVLGSDGIVDEPYIIDDNNRDNYPLVEPFSPLPRTISKLTAEIEKCWTEGEIDNKGIVKSLIAKLNVAQKLVDKGKIDEAKSILEDDFIPQVQNLSGIHITAEAVDILIKSVEYILPLL